MPKKRKKLAQTDSLYVARSSLGGRGVFAGKVFQKGDLVERCPYLRLEADDADGLLLDYVFEDGEDTVVLPLGYGLLYNHDSPGNLEHYDDEVDEVFEYYAIRRVEQGEELCLDYGEDWWDTRGLTPKRPRRPKR
jgi:hypothetical protein